MATEAAQQIIDSAVELSGLSIVTATKTNAAPRLGSIYRPDLLAAAVPIWFHPLQTGNYLGLFRQRWTGATIGSGGPQTYSAKTISLLPSWANISPATGSTEAIAEIPSQLSGTRVLNGATSRVDFLYTIGTVDGVPHLAHHRVSPLGQLLLQGEEVLPPADTGDVSFKAGLYIDGRHLVVFGVDGANKIYRARKSWGRIGIGVDPNEQWQFKGVKGWYSDPAELDPEPGPTADVVSTAGLVSVAQVRDRTYIAAMSGGTAVVYSSRAVDAKWRNEDQNITGGWVYLQPQLYYQASNVPEGFRIGIPYVKTTIDNTAGATALNVAWGLVGV